MAFLGIDNRRDLPKVSYSTALDFYVGTCFAFVLVTIIQFAGVHFHTKHGSGEHQDDDDDDDHEMKQEGREEETEGDGDDEEEEEEEQEDNGSVQSTFSQRDAPLQVQNIRPNSCLLGISWRNVQHY